eukprot:525873-Amphidinium_carterae.2
MLASKSDHGLMSIDVSNAFNSVNHNAMHSTIQWQLQHWVHVHQQAGDMCLSPNDADELHDLVHKRQRKIQQIVQTVLHARANFALKCFSSFCEWLLPGVDTAHVLDKLRMELHKERVFHCLRFGGLCLTSATNTKETAIVANWLQIVAGLLPEAGADSVHKFPFWHMPRRALRTHRPE